MSIGSAYDDIANGKDVVETTPTTSDYDSIADAPYKELPVDSHASQYDAIVKGAKPNKRQALMEQLATLDYQLNTTSGKLRKMERARAYRTKEKVDVFSTTPTQEFWVTNDAGTVNRKFGDRKSAEQFIKNNPGIGIGLGGKMSIKVTETKAKQAVRHKTAEDVDKVLYTKLSKQLQDLHSQRAKLAAHLNDPDVKRTPEEQQEYKDYVRKISLVDNMKPPDTPADAVEVYWDYDKQQIRFIGSKTKLLSDYTPEQVQDMWAGQTGRYEFEHQLDRDLAHQYNVPEEVVNSRTSASLLQDMAENIHSQLGKSVGQGLFTLATNAVMGTVFFPKPGTPLIIGPRELGELAVAPAKLAKGGTDWLIAELKRRQVDEATANWLAHTYVNIVDEVAKDGKIRPEKFGVVWQKMDEAAQIKFGQRVRNPVPVVGDTPTPAQVVAQDAVNQSFKPHEYKPGDRIAVTKQGNTYEGTVKDVLGRGYLVQTDAGHMFTAMYEDVYPNILFQQVKATTEKIRAGKVAETESEHVVRLRDEFINAFGFTEEQADHAIAVMQATGQDLSRVSVKKSTLEEVIGRPAYYQSDNEILNKIVREVTENGKSVTYDAIKDSHIGTLSDMFKLKSVGILDGMGKQNIKLADLTNILTNRGVKKEEIEYVVDKALEATRHYGDTDSMPANQISSLVKSEANALFEFTKYGQPDKSLMPHIVSEVIKQYAPDWDLIPSGNNQFWTRGTVIYDSMNTLDSIWGEHEVNGAELYFAEKQKHGYYIDHYVKGDDLREYLIAINPNQEKHIHNVFNFAEKVDLNKDLSTQLSARYENMTLDNSLDLIAHSAGSDIKRQEKLDKVGATYTGRNPDNQTYRERVFQYDPSHQVTVGHFGPNSVFHYRYNVVKDIEGNQILFLEEAQSDWAAHLALWRKINNPEYRQAIKDDADKVIQDLMSNRDSINAKLDKQRGGGFYFNEQGQLKRKPGFEHTDLIDPNAEGPGSLAYKLHDVGDVIQQYIDALEEVFNKHQFPDMGQVGQNLVDLPHHLFAKSDTYYTIQHEVQRIFDETAKIIPKAGPGPFIKDFNWTTPLSHALIEDAKSQGITHIAIPSADIVKITSNMGDEKARLIYDVSLPRIFDKVVGNPQTKELQFRYWNIPVRTYDISSKIIQGVEESGKPILFQDVAKGAVEFKTLGRKTIHAFEGADFSTAIHEIGHIARKQLSHKSPEYKFLERWAGVKDGKWTRDAEEKFARAFEQYVANGTAPTPELKTAFGKMRNWMKEIYAKAEDITGAKLSRKTRKVLDTIFQKGTPTTLNRHEVSDVVKAEIKAAPKSGEKKVLKTYADMAWVKNLSEEGQKAATKVLKDIDRSTVSVEQWQNEVQKIANSLSDEDKAELKRHGSSAIEFGRLLTVGDAASNRATSLRLEVERMSASGEPKELIQAKLQEADLYDEIAQDAYINAQGSVSEAGRVLRFSRERVMADMDEYGIMRLAERTAKMGGIEVGRETRVKLKDLIKTGQKIKAKIDKEEISASLRELPDRMTFKIGDIVDRDNILFQANTVSPSYDYEEFRATIKIISEAIYNGERDIDKLIRIAHVNYGSVGGAVDLTEMQAIDAVSKAISQVRSLENRGRAEYGESTLAVGSHAMTSPEISALRGELDDLRAQMSKIINDLNRPGFWENARHALRAWRLSYNIEGRLIDVGSNAIHSAVDKVLVNSLASAIDKIAWYKTVKAEGESVSAFSISRYGSTLANRRKEWRTLLKNQLLKGDSDIATKYHFRREFTSDYLGGKLEKAVRFGARTAGVTDVTFKDFQYHYILDEVASMQAKHEKLTGDAFNRRKLALMDIPADHSTISDAELKLRQQLHSVALEESLRVIAANDSFFSRKYHELELHLVKQLGSEYGHGMMFGVDLIIQFPRIFWNFAGRTVDYTPLGILKGAGAWVHGRHSGGFTLIQRRMINKWVASGMIGTAAYYTGKWVIQANPALKGYVAPSYVDMGDADQLATGGFKSFMYGMAEATIDKDPELTVDQKRLLKDKTLLALFTDQPAIEAPTELLDKLKRGELGAWLQKLLASAVVPGAVKAIARRVDKIHHPMVRRRYPRNLWEQILYYLPIYRESVPPIDLKEEIDN